MKNTLILINEKVAEEQAKWNNNAYLLWLQVQAVRYDFVEIHEFQILQLSKDGITLKNSKKKDGSIHNEIVTYKIDDFESIMVFDKKTKISLEHPNIIQTSLGSNCSTANTVFQSDIVEWLELGKEDSLFYSNFTNIERIVRVASNLRTRVNKTELLLGLKRFLKSNKNTEGNQVRFAYQPLHDFFSSIFGFMRTGSDIAMTTIYNMLEKDQSLSDPVYLRDIPTWLVVYDLVINDLYRDDNKLIKLTEDDINLFEQSYIGLDGRMYESLTDKVCRMLRKIVSSMLTHGNFKDTDYIRLDVTNMLYSLDKMKGIRTVEFRTEKCEEPVIEFSKVYVLGKLKNGNYI